MRSGKKRRQPTTEPSSRISAIHAVILGAFFLSGLCGLMYEVVWARMLTLVFGNTLHAVATVLSVFMLGLALGSFIAGRYTGRMTRHREAYACVEMALGAYAGFFPVILHGLQQVHSLVFQAVYNSPFSLSLVRLLLATGILLLPTTLMGATLPLLSQLLTQSASTFAKEIGQLYAINTIGAALGAFLSAFLTIPVLGLHWAMYLGAGLNIAIGLVVLKLPYSGPQYQPGTKKKERDAAPVGATAPRDRLCVLLAFAVVGFVAMLLENGWSHALIMVFGTSVYAFATMLTTYLVGLGVGSLLAARFADRMRSPRSLFVFLVALLGLSTFATTPVIGMLPSWFVEVFADLKAEWTRVAFLEFAVCFLVILGPTLLSGACFPVAVRLTGSAHGAGKAAANAYTFNTTGCIVGSLAAGFFLIPTLGAEHTLLLAGVLSVLAAAFLIALDGSTSLPRRTLWVTAMAAVAVAGFSLLGSWDAMVMNSGVYVYSRLLKATGSTSIREAMADYKMLYYKEGSASVAVLESGQGHRFLRINGKTDGSSQGDNYTQMFLGYVPALYAKHLDDVLVIGLGTGITSGCVLDLPVRSVDTIEISPEVIKAAHFFSRLSGSVFSDPRSTIRLLDGRTWLMAMPRQYDIITSEPSNPWQTGNANLFTVDFFRMVARRLKPGGIFCQWLPFYHMAKSHYKLIVKSLSAVFPHVNIWLANSDTLIISSLEPLSITQERLTRIVGIPAVKRKLATMQIQSADDLLSFFYLDEAAARQIGSGVEGYNLDSHPVVEFGSPKYILSPGQADVLYSILDNSYSSSLPLQGAKDMSLVQMRRILSRERFYELWQFPRDLIDTVIERGLNR
jgi:spermidine synthase